MATPDWTTVPDTSLEPGDPIRSIDIIAINNHAASMAGGAAGSPEIKLMAIETISAGATIRSRVDGEDSAVVPVNNPSPITVSGGEVHSFSFAQIGSVRVTAQHRQAGGGTSTLYMSHYRNGVVTTYTYTTTSAAYVTRSRDFDILPGDKITITHEVTGTTGDYSYTRYVRFQTDGENLWPGVYVRLENDYTVV